VRDYRRLVLARVGTTVRTTMPHLGVEDPAGTENIHLPVRAAVRAGRRFTPG
jgi:hypothetical protein